MSEALVGAGGGGEGVEAGGGTWATGPGRGVVAHAANVSAKPAHNLSPVLHLTRHCAVMQTEFYLPAECAVNLKMPRSCVTPLPH